MFWLVRWTLSILFKLKIVLLSVAAGMGIAFGLGLRDQYRTWGIAPTDVEKDFPGDDAVSSPDLVETRSLVIEGAPDAVWPWLAQMGFGRGGWYGFRQLDRPWSPTGGWRGSSADELIEGLGELAEGDLVPTHPEGGFVVRLAEPGRALVLYLDDGLVREQAKAAAKDDPDGAGAGLVDADMPSFAFTWAFRLDAKPGKQTRLSERVRLRFDDVSEAQRRALPLAKAGIFAMLRSQMLGIQRRVERQGRDA